MLGILLYSLVLPANANRNDFEKLLSEGQDLTKKGEFADAYDMILVASRLMPSDHRLIYAVDTFVNEAIKSNSDEAKLLAEDLLGRCETLVHFQSRENVKDTRRRLTALQEQFDKNDRAPQAVSSPLKNSGLTRVL